MDVAVLEKIYQHFYPDVMRDLLIFGPEFVNSDEYLDKKVDDIKEFVELDLK